VQTTRSTPDQMLWLRIVFLGLTALFFVSCAGETSKTMPRYTTKGDTKSPDELCRELLLTQDSDKDGLTDHEELYGYPISEDSDEMVYSDPLLKDTDGDGRSDGTESANSKIEGSNATISEEFAMHPARKDYLIQVHARGGSNGAQTSGISSWNSWTKLKMNAGEKILIRDTRLSQWSVEGGTTPPNPVNVYANGSSAMLNEPGNQVNHCGSLNTCIVGIPRAELIMKFADTETGQGTGLVRVGNQLASEESEAEMSGPGSNQFVLLKANDRDNTATISSNLADNTGFLTLYVAMLPGDDDALYPQREPSAAEEEAALDTLCSQSNTQQAGSN